MTTGKHESVTTGKHEAVTTGHIAPHTTGVVAPHTTGHAAPHTTGHVAPITSGKHEVTTDCEHPEHMTTGKHESVTTGRAAPVTTGRAAPMTTSHAAPLTTGRIMPMTTSHAIPLTTAHFTPVTTGECVCPVSSTSTSSSTGKISTSTSSTSSTSSSTGKISTSTSSSSGKPSTSTSSSSTTGSPSNGKCPIDSAYTCPGLSFSLGNQALSFANYDVISFNNFVAASGDIEGRLAVKNSVQIGGGYSIGASITSSDAFSYYSLIAGSLSWGTGALYPDGSSASREKAYVATKDVSVPSNLQSDIEGPCADSSCLTSIFNGALSCYSDLQNDLAALTPNVQVSLKNTGIQLTCDSPSSSIYVAFIGDDMFAAANWFNLINCGSNADWIINVNGTGAVSFHGGSFPATPENVVFNVLGSGRTISVTTAVNGAILAPRNYLDQTTGVVIGKVVVGDIFFSLQINKPSCTSSSSSSTYALAEAKTQVNQGDNSSVHSGSSVVAYSSVLIVVLFSLLF